MTALEVWLRLLSWLLLPEPLGLGPKELLAPPLGLPLPLLLNVGLKDLRVI